MRATLPAAAFAMSATVAFLLGVAVGSGTVPPRIAPPSFAAVDRELGFEATSYCDQGTTFAGVPAGLGVAAADPAVLPQGSVIRLRFGDPWRVLDGVYVVLDTGSAVRRRIVDVWLPSCAAALQFGRRPASVEILRHGWEPQPKPGG